MVAYLLERKKAPNILLENTNKLIACGIRFVFFLFFDSIVYQIKVCTKYGAFFFFFLYSYHCEKIHILKSIKVSIIICQGFFGDQDEFFFFVVIDIIINSSILSPEFSFITENIKYDSKKNLLTTKPKSPQPIS